MKARFTRYGNHQPSWWMHSNASETFKEWYQKSEYNQRLTEFFLKEPEEFLNFITHNNWMIYPDDEKH